MSVPDYTVVTIWPGGRFTFEEHVDLTDLAPPQIRILPAPTRDLPDIIIIDDEPDDIIVWEAQVVYTLL